MSQIFDALRIVVTQGRYMGEEGISYQWLAPGQKVQTGDISRITNGYYQGYNERCRICVFRDDAELLDLEEHGVYLFLPKGEKIPTEGGLMDVSDGIDANLALALGLAEIVKEGTQ